jgi:NOL1/NOP2/fmu family ribosome biogenesis protein
VPEPQRSAVLGYFEARFGVPLAAFAGYRLLERRKVYALVRESPHLETLASLKVQSVGLPVLRKMPHHLKPTTAALQRFGRHVTRHKLELSTSQMQALLQNQELSLHIDVQPGYVMLLHAGHVLGCGLYTPGRLRSQIPRRQSAHQRFAPD